MTILDAKRASEILEELNTLQDELRCFSNIMSASLGVIYKDHGTVVKSIPLYEEDWRLSALIEAYHKRISELEEELEKL